MIVEIFKTNINTEREAINVVNALCKDIKAFKINIDLDDLDKVLRIEAETICPDEIINILSNFEQFYF